jgi:hypothetical protein
MNFKPIFEVSKLPVAAVEVDVRKPFSNDELLFRRAFPSELNSKGELVPIQLESFRFSKDVEGAPSFLRGAYAVPRDAIHRDCAADKDVSGSFVFQIFVSELPGPIETGDGKRRYSFWPVPDPIDLCGAHCVIGSYLHDDPTRTYSKPSSAVFTELRAQICAALNKRGPVISPPTGKA